MEKERVEKDKRPLLGKEKNPGVKKIEEDNALENQEGEEVAEEDKKLL
jgi:hypothetical protein